MVSYAKLHPLLIEGDVFVVSLAENTELITVREAADKIVGAVPTHVTGVILDLAEAPSLDSRGVHILLEAVDRLRMRQQTAYLVAPEGSAIRRLLAIVGIIDVIPVVGSIDEALVHIRKTADQTG